MSRELQGKRNAFLTDNEGGRWVDEEDVVSTSGPNTIVSSRKPEDLEAFNRPLVSVSAGRAAHDWGEESL